MTRRSAFTFYTTPFAIACASLCREGGRGRGRGLACVLFSCVRGRAGQEEPEFDRFIYLFTSPEYGSTERDYTQHVRSRARRTHMRTCDN